MGGLVGTDTFTVNKANVKSSSILVKKIACKNILKWKNKYRVYIGSKQNRLNSIIWPYKAVHYGPYIHNHSQE